MTLKRTISGMIGTGSLAHNRREFIAENVESYSTSGTPADCVKVGIESILRDIEIDLVLSGINNGPNLGTDVIYSGTVAAAIEGLIEGKPSIALSCDSSKVSSDEYREAAKYTAKLIQKLEGNLDKLNGNILNVNFPTGEKKGVRITKLGNKSCRLFPGGSFYVTA